ncbi:hypothetical protein GCM10010218_15020 [Streptomyces mashuensis]|uniref:Uncharacterized protein n=1 Tax=Streptomyces mashuensis TaxID=33904 RepID=A0A919B1L5_9ACTN|nr:hypothetical protein GCM10010218_15020 [Streptomyces mashuensis]
MFVPEPVQAQYGFPEYVRVSGQAQPGQIESSEMDTQHQTPTTDIGNLPPLTEYAHRYEVLPRPFGHS